MRNQISLIPALLVRLRIVKCALREWDFEARVYFNRHYLRAKAEIVKMVHLTAQLSLSLPALSLYKVKSATTLLDAREEEAKLLIQQVYVDKQTLRAYSLTANYLQ